MERYTEHQLLRLAKRHHNTKRTYLLVDPLQGKHIPVSPTASLAMLNTLGQGFAKAAPQVDLVIGFAETATAVGAAVAGMLGPHCRYIHTTREPAVIHEPGVSFQEEHSHAVDQFLSLSHCAEWIRQARAIAFVDDELSTGKTLLNIISELKQQFPCLAEKPLWAVSIINRLSDDRLALMQQHGVQCFSLLHLPMEDYTAKVAGYEISEPLPPQKPAVPSAVIELPPMTCDTRHGAVIGDFTAQCEALANTVLAQLGDRLHGKRIAVIGTEEWMYPGLLLGRAIEQAGLGASVVSHATTRSPIGLCSAAEYPIQTGVKLHSFYEAGRTTYLYDLQPCDVVIVLTDAAGDEALLAASELHGAFRSCGCEDFILIREAKHVQHLST